MVVCVLEGLDAVPQSHAHVAGLAPEDPVHRNIILLAQGYSIFPRRKLTPALDLVVGIGGNASPLSKFPLIKVKHTAYEPKSLSDLGS